MFKSLIKASLISGLGSLFSYLIIVVLARAEDTEGFAEFTYALAWGLVFTLVIDVAAEQCVPHFYKLTNASPGILLVNVYILKIVLLTIVCMFLLSLDFFSLIDLPYSMFLFLVPAFYLAPFFEIKGLNVQYVRLQAAEKLLLLIVCFVCIRYGRIGNIVYFAYFSISVFSLLWQIKVLDFKLRLLNEINLSCVVKYLVRYWPVYLILLSQIFYGHISRIIIEAKMGLIAFASVSLSLQILNAVSIVQTQVDRHFRLVLIESVIQKNVQEVVFFSAKYVMWYVVPLAIFCLFLFHYSEEIITTLYGKKWVDAALYLKFLCPLVITVAVLRYLDILSVALNSSKVNLTVSLLSAVILTTSLCFLSVERSVVDFLSLIVGVQSFHAIILFSFLANIFIRYIQSS